MFKSIMKIMAPTIRQIKRLNQLISFLKAISVIPLGIRFSKRNNKPLTMIILRSKTKIKWLYIDWKGNLI